MSTLFQAEPPYPIHESVLHKLDPEYVAFYNKYIINQQQVHYQPVAASRTSGVLIPGASEALPVGSTVDHLVNRTVSEGPAVPIRVFTPTLQAPANGWPVFCWIHGGGWVLGNIATENVVCTRLCEGAGAVVISVDYRLAPEHIWPAAVHDCWEVLLWLKREGKDVLNVDIGRFAIGGSSAGGNLAAVMTHRALAQPDVVPRISFQILIVPVCDNTAWIDTHDSYKENENTAALPASKMLWYRLHYLPDRNSWMDPEASPAFYPDSNFATLPSAFVAVAQLDVLRSEGELYADRLAENGVATTLKIYPGMPHPFMAMDGVLTQGKKLVADMVSALKNAL